jgi:hypothetical protein
VEYEVYLHLNFPDLVCSLEALSLIAIADCWFALSLNNRGHVCFMYVYIWMWFLLLQVQWPLSLILTERSMEYYNTVFQFLLKIKWALFSLQKLRFSGCYQL